MECVLPYIFTGGTSSFTAAVATVRDVHSALEVMLSQVVAECQYSFLKGTKKNLNNILLNTKC